MFPKSIGIWCVFLGVLTLVHSKTDSKDVSALNVMFNSLNFPNQLSGWQSGGGDPCGDSWKGVTCSGSKVTEIKLSDLGLRGTLGYQLSSLSSVTYFDVSKNNIYGDIPYQLPPNAAHIDLSHNDLTGSVPYSLSQMSDLELLDLSHNKLNGQLNDIFGQLHKLDLLDLSYNSLTGNLPQSFKSLSSLSSLFLQNNQFTGQINVLATLKLEELNLADNQFSGWIPNELMKIKSLNIEGNAWSSGPAPPGMASSNSVSISSGKSSGTLIAAVVLGVLLGVTILVAVISKRRSSFSSNLLDEHDSLSHHKPFHSLDSDRYPNESHTDTGKDFRDLKSLDSSRSINVKALQSSPPVGLATSLSYRIKSFRSNDHKNHTSVKRSSSFRVASFVLSDLQIATSNFATNRLLGEGSIGRVYKAKYADGKVLAVKKINSSFFQDGKTEKFSEIVSDVTKLYHPNIVELIGYCSEQGHNMLVYDYFRNGSLHEFLHLSDEFSKPLTWNTRVRIALGTARAVEYLHETCSPPLLHNNIKSSNILLDAELNPRLSDCGFATFYQDTNQNVEDGYKAPECIKGSAPTLKSDVYSFGVVMLELLTGRMPFDSTKTRSEQYLVHWATPQLHDIDALGEMVDPALRGLYPPKSISRFADIIALCVQLEPGFRPPMSEVVQSLLSLAHSPSMSRRGDDLGGSHRMDDDDF